MTNVDVDNVDVDNVDLVVSKSSLDIRRNEGVYLRQFPIDVKVFSSEYHKVKTYIKQCQVWREFSFIVGVQVLNYTYECII